MCGGMKYRSKVIRIIPFPGVDVFKGPRLFEPATTSPLINNSQIGLQV